MSLRALPFVATLALVAAACGGGESATDSTAIVPGSDTAAAGGASTAAAPGKVGQYTGVSDGAGGTVNFMTPESVAWDEAMDGYWVSNINGNPGAKDNNGFIAWVPAEGDSTRVVVRGGQRGVTLHAPKGMAISGDTLFVADIDAVRAFDKRTGRALMSTTVPNAVFLNDVALGPDGAVYVTDTGIRFGSDGSMSHPGPDRIYRVAGRNVRTAVEFDSLVGPNGLAWDPTNARWIVVTFAANQILAVDSAGRATPIATGPGQFDGIERTRDGRWLVSSWADSSIYAVPAGGGEATRLITGVPSPADIGYDAKRNRLLVPLFEANRVEAYELR